MAEDRVERKLAAILVADVVGYSRMMSKDEAGTLARLKALRRELFEPKTKQHRGRIFKTTGDGALVEFRSAVDAVNSAVDIQRALAERAEGVAVDRRIRLRIGVSLGDVIVEGSDLYGNGVNVAARMERLAEPGGICISGNVHEHVRGIAGLAFDDLGKQEVKNIAEPVHAYRVNSVGSGGGAEPVRQPVDASTSLPDKPSIAVLPFQNMSGDPEQEYFADGMVEEIITALSRFSWLLVMARNSSFIYKGRAVDVRRVAEELGVRYVLEGSVRRAGQRIRITGQLIDATTGAHIWADRFDGDAEDIFDLQDKVTECVIGAIEPTLRKAEIERARRKRPDSLAAYDLFLRALTPLHKLRPEANAEALRLLEQAIAIDSGYAPALAYAAWCYEQRVLHGWSTALEADTAAAVRLAREALAIDSGEAAAIAMASFVLTLVGRDHDGGRRAAQRALDLNPNSPTVCWMAGWVIMLGGDPQGAASIFERSLRLSPSDPAVNYLLNGLGMSHLIRGHPEDAYECGLKAAALDPDVDVIYYVLIAACGYLGRIDEAKKAIAKLQSLAPGITTASFRKRMPFRNEEHMNMLLDGLRKAGLP
jgi:TolB-like protein/Flp pilus assembly protein TadD